MKNVVTIRGTLHHMAEAQIASMLPADVLAGIKAKDEHPQFRAYAVAHEGEAQGRMLGVGKVVIQYLRDVIGQIHDKLTPGTPFFSGHGKTNEHGGRTRVGELVGKTIETINGVAHDVALAYIYPEHRDKVFDVASIEAEDVLITDAGGERATAASVGAITGIALGDSRTDSPGFPGATLLATLQAFAGEKDQPMTLEELKKAINEAGYTPSQVFASEALIADSAVKEHVSKEKQEAHEAKRRIATDLGEKLDQMRAERTTLEEQLRAAKAETLRASAGKIAGPVIEEKKLTKEQAAFVNKRLAGFTPTGADDASIKASISEFIDASVKELTETLELVGVKPAVDPAPKGTPPTDAERGTDGYDAEDPYMDPKNNPLL